MIKTKNGVMYDPNKLKTRTIDVIEYLISLPENVTVDPADVAGYLAGYMGNGPSKDEITTF